MLAKPFKKESSVALRRRHQKWSASISQCSRRPGVGVHKASEPSHGRQRNNRAVVVVPAGDIALVFHSGNRLMRGLGRGGAAEMAPWVGASGLQTARIGHYRWGQSLTLVSRLQRDHSYSRMLVSMLPFLYGW